MSFAARLIALQQSGRRFGDKLVAAVERLSVREQGLLLGLGIAVSAGLFVTLVWRPLVDARAHAESDLRRYRMVLARLEQTGDAVASQPPIFSSPLSPIDSAAAAGLAVTRVEPSDDEIRLIIDDADFANVLAWLRDLEMSGSGRLAAISLERLPEPGRVRADVTLRNTP